MVYESLDPPYIEFKGLTYKRHHIPLEKRQRRESAEACSLCDLLSLEDGCLSLNNIWSCHSGTYYKEVDPLYEDLLKAKEIADDRGK